MLAKSQKYFLTLLKIFITIFAVQLPSHAGSEWGVCRLNKDNFSRCMIEHYNGGISIAFGDDYRINLKHTDFGLIRTEDGRTCKRKVTSDGYTFVCSFKSDRPSQVDIIEAKLDEPPRYTFDF